MDDEDMRWLNGFNSKAEGGSGSSATANGGGADAGSPLNGRERRIKGKDREKEAPTTLTISEDVFEYVMGMMEKFTEDTVPMLHTVSRHCSTPRHATRKSRVK